MGDPHADFSTFVSQLANRSVLIDSETTETESLSVAHKVFPRSIKEKVKIEEIYVEKLPLLFFLFCVLFKILFMYLFNTLPCIYLILFRVLHPIGCK